MKPEENAPLAPGLYLCATPIGNMEDITLRAVRVLGSVAAVYCEDTRRTGALLHKLGVKKPLVSCREQNEAARAQEIVARALSGEAVAYVSDAGTPGVSDPGERLVSACIGAGAPFTVVPGASAMTTALVLSGFPAANACFAGFLPREGKPRRAALDSLAKHPGALIFYESPLRVAATAKELAQRLGDRGCALCRELTKLHEEVVRTSLSALAERYADAPPRGECVLVVEGAKEEAALPAADARTLAESLLASGLSAKDASVRLMELAGLSKNEAYAVVKSVKADGK